jgi:hypothetical protein
VSAAAPGHAVASASIDVGSSGGTSHPATVVRCVVPRLTDRTLAAARTALKRAHCALGSLRRAHGKQRKGRVLPQGAKAREHLAGGARVKLVLSLGPAPRHHR